MFLNTWLGEVQERAGVGILSVLLWDGTPMFTHDELHPHSAKKKIKHMYYCILRLILIYLFLCNIRLRDF